LLSAARCVAVSALGAAPGAPAASTSSLLAKLQSFLPAMKEANDALQSKIAKEGSEAVNIEAVDEAAPHILMVRRCSKGAHGGASAAPGFVNDVRQTDVRLSSPYLCL
jgi:hypothetical protein